MTAAALQEIVLSNSALLTFSHQWNWWMASWAAWLIDSSLMKRDKVFLYTLLHKHSSPSFLKDQVNIDLLIQIHVSKSKKHEKIWINHHNRNVRYPNLFKSKNRSSGARGKGKRRTELQRTFRDYTRTYACNKIRRKSSKRLMVYVQHLTQVRSCPSVKTNCLCGHEWSFVLYLLNYHISFVCKNKTRQCIKLPAKFLLGLNIFSITKK